MANLILVIFLILLTVENMQSGIGVFVEDPILKVIISLVSILIVWGFFELLAKPNRKDNN